MCDPKEPDFFSDFKHPRYRMFDTLEEYLQLFKNAGEEHEAVGEASVSYLGTPGALERLHEFEPQAKIIVMVRNPIDAVQSMHSQRVYSMLESEKEFENAWRLQDERSRGIGIPKRARDARIYMYRELARFGTQIERLLTIFDRNQVLIIVFDDFVRDTRAVYESVLSFLGVPSDNRSDFPRINENKRHKVEFVGRLIIRPPRAIMRPVYHLKSLLGIERTGILRRLQKMNADKKKRSPLRPEFRAELVEAFREEVEKLETILNRDLSHWLKDDSHQRGEKYDSARSSSGGQNGM